MPETSAASAASDDDPSTRRQQAEDRLGRVLDEGRDHNDPEYGSSCHPPPPIAEGLRPWPDQIDRPNYPCCYRCFTGRHGECDASCECPCGTGASSEQGASDADAGRVRSRRTKYDGLRGRLRLYRDARRNAADLWVKVTFQIRDDSPAEALMGSKGHPSILDLPRPYRREALRRLRAYYVAAERRQS
jgi:hypothetical protein